MLVSIFQFLIEFFFGFFSKIVMTIIHPFIDKLVEWGALPTNYLTVLNNFVDDLVNYIKFAKHAIVNITGIPSQIFNILCGLLIFTFTLKVATYAVRALLNVWSIFRTGNSIYSTFNK